MMTCIILLDIMLSASLTNSTKAASSQASGSAIELKEQVFIGAWLGDVDDEEAARVIAESHPISRSFLTQARGKTTVVKLEPYHRGFKLSFYLRDLKGLEADYFYDELFFKHPLDEDLASADEKMAQSLTIAQSEPYCNEPAYTIYSHHSRALRLLEESLAQKLTPIQAIDAQKYYKWFRRYHISLLHLIAIADSNDGNVEGTINRLLYYMIMRWIEHN
jgi:hypothetical protein